MTFIVASSPERAAAPLPTSRRLLVSIHDVTPALEPAVHALWRACVDRGVVPALLVVPDWHGSWPLESHPRFAAWLRECAASGAEIFVHGERHDEEGLPRGWADAWHAWGKTAREGEFLTLDEQQARTRIARGMALLERLGLTPLGFVPPAWLARPACWLAVSTLGLRVSEDDRAIRVHTPAKIVRITSPVVRWSSRSTVRAHGSAAVAAARQGFQRRAPVVRLAFHPSDLAHPVTARSSLHALEWWLGDREPGTYEELARAIE